MTPSFFMVIYIGFEHLYRFWNRYLFNMERKEKYLSCDCHGHSLYTYNINEQKCPPVVSCKVIHVSGSIYRSSESGPCLLEMIEQSRQTTEAVNDIRIIWNRTFYNISLYNKGMGNLVSELPMNFDAFLGKWTPGWFCGNRYPAIVEGTTRLPGDCNE